MPFRTFKIILSLFCWSGEPIASALHKHAMNFVFRLRKAKRVSVVV